MAQHRDITPEQNHTPYRWIVADAAARDAITPTVDDIGKRLWKQDDDSEWTLKSAGPAVWVIAAPVQSVHGRTGAVVGQTGDYSPAQVGADPAGTASQAVTDHEAKADPHPQYTTEAEAAAAAPVQSVDGKTGAVDLSADYEPRRKHNLTATTDPTLTDDSSLGYEPMSKWINTVTGEIFALVDDSVGGADWQKSTLTLDDLGSAATAETTDFAPASHPSETQTHGAPTGERLAHTQDLWISRHKATTHNFTTDADYTLTATQETYGRLIFTDTTPVLTAARSVIVSTDERPYVIQNDTAQVLTVKTSAGTGVAVAAGSVGLVQCDGANVIPHGAPVGERLVHTGDVGTFAYADYNAAPFLNVLSDSGRFDSGTGGWSTTTAGPYANSAGYFNSLNGATFSEAGKFIQNNTDFGGTAGSMTQTTIDLLEAQGRNATAKRYGVEFYLSEITAGSGTAVARTFPSGEKYLLTTNGSAAIFGANGYTTFSAWVRAIGQTLGVRDAGNLFIDGAEMPNGDAEIAVADGWVHLRHVSKNPSGYDNAFPYLFSASGGGAQIAVPAVFNGVVDTGVHSSPLIGYAAGGL